MALQSGMDYGRAFDMAAALVDGDEETKKKLLDSKEKMFEGESFSKVIKETQIGKISSVRIKPFLSFFFIFSPVPFSISHSPSYILTFHYPITERIPISGIITDKSKAPTRMGKWTGISERRYIFCHKTKGGSAPDPS